MAKKRNKQPAPPVVKELIKLDVACGQRKQPGFVGVDIAACEVVDVVHNLNMYPWPFEDNSVSDVFCSHYIEHIPMAYWHPGNKYSVVAESDKAVDAWCKFMEELHRIMAPGAKAVLIAPYYQSERCWQDPTHRRAICNATMFYLSKEWRKINGLDHYNLFVDFEAVWGYDMDPEWNAKHDEARAYGVKHHWNVIRDIHINLTKKQIPS